MVLVEGVQNTTFRIAQMRSCFKISFLLLIVIVLIPYVIANWDPYKILGVKRVANIEQIKKAYRDLAKKLHPDTSFLSGKEANRRFIELNKAYNILKDPAKRKRYDHNGETEGSGPTLFNRVVWRFADYVLHVIYYIASRESLFTILILIICALITSLFLYHSPSPPDTQSENPPPSHNTEFSGNRDHSSNHNPQTPVERASMDELRIIELKAETYNGMIRLLKPGYRSIILLNDQETKQKLLPIFKKAVWPYRRNKTLLFGYLCLDRNLEWYESLLKEVLGVDDLNVNKKNCIGTVLSLNGFKKYFRVYHAKHHEIDYYDDETDNDGSFLGFNDNDLEERCVEQGSSVESVCTVDNLLDRLPIWLDKTFDGMTKRYFLDSWPSEIR